MAYFQSIKLEKDLRDLSESLEVMTIKTASFSTTRALGKKKTNKTHQLMSSYCQSNELKMDMKHLNNNFFWTKLKWSDRQFPLFSCFNLRFPFVQQVLVSKPMTLSVIVGGLSRYRTGQMIFGATLKSKREENL